MESNLEDTRMQNEELNKFISFQVQVLNQKVLDVYIKKYGKVFMEKYQKDLLYTIKTIIHLIMNYLTWNVSKEENIKVITSQTLGKMKNIKRSKLIELEKELQKELLDLKNGIKPKKGKRLQKEMLNFLLQELNLFVWSVPNHLLQQVSQEENFVVKNVQENGTHENGEKNILTTTLVTIKPLKEERDVYNLFVEDTHEYYANGILVHNCFADLYSYLAMLGNGAGVFFKELTEADRPSVLGRDNTYDITRAFVENNYGN
jgi:hypothetical protein